MTNREMMEIAMRQSAEDMGCCENDFKVNKNVIVTLTTLIISKKPGNTGISRDIRTEFTTDLLLSD